MPERERLDYELLIVGAGPAGLAAAIRYKQLRPQAMVCVLEKGISVGAHLVSGALLDLHALDELLPDWRLSAAPVGPAVARERHVHLTARRARTLPWWPSFLRHDGAHIVRLGLLCQWLAARAEALGVDIFTATVASEPLFGADGALNGVLTGDFGLDERGRPGARWQPGIAIHARHTLLAEGSRGHLGRQIIRHFGLDAGRQSQNYALGIKELWRLSQPHRANGEVWHSFGWPLGGLAGGGGFCYAFDDQLIALGLITHLGYRHPGLSPYDEMQRWKTHPHLATLLAGGERIGFGARSLTLGGLPALPRVTFPGGGLIGDDAGFAVAARLMGIHAAMKSGMLMAEACADGGREPDFATRFTASWLYDELWRTRAFKGAMRLGPWLGGALFTLDQWLGSVIDWAPPLRADHLQFVAARRLRPRPPVAKDGQLTFTRTDSLRRAGVRHAEGQPGHLLLRDAQRPLTVNWPRYGGPETHYCPAGVYEYLVDGDQPRLVLHTAHCLHCKTCDILDPGQNIVWRPPQGGDGPRYVGL